MISSVEVQNASGLTQSFNIDNDSNGYQIRDIEGLDPVRANLVSTSFANTDGEQYQSSRREKRNIILTIGLVPDFINYSVSDLRQHLYNFFMPKSTVDMWFYRTDGVPVRISGRVETFDAPIFTRDPSVSISIVCFDPDFKSNDNIVNGFSKSSNSLDPIEYLGTVSSGFILEITISNSINGFTARTRRDGETERSLIYDGALSAGDIITLSTVPGNKYINRLRSSTLSSILSGVSPYSDWISFEPGNNNFGLQIDSGTPQEYKLTYVTRLGGL